MLTKSYVFFPKEITSCKSTKSRKYQIKDMKKMLSMMYLNFISLNIFSKLLKKKKNDVLKFLELSGKPNFLESVTFHLEMFPVTKFGIFLGFCIVHVTIFIK